MIDDTLRSGAADVALVARFNKSITTINNGDVNNADEHVADSSKISRRRGGVSPLHLGNTPELIIHRGEFRKRRLFIVGRNVIWRIVSSNYAHDLDGF